MIYKSVSNFSKGNGNTWSHPQLECVCTVYTVYVSSNNSAYGQKLKKLAVKKPMDFTLDDRKEELKIHSSDIQRVC